MAGDAIPLLLVEDDEDDYVLTRETVGEIADACYEVVWRADYEEGLSALAEGRFEVCLVDYRIGARTGLEFVEAAKQAGIATPLILLTGVGQQEIDLAATSAGAADFLEKSALTPELLGRSMRFARAEARARSALAEQSSLLQATLDHTGAAIAALDALGEVVASNEAFREVLASLHHLLPQLGVGPARGEPAASTASECGKVALEHLIALCAESGGQPVELSFPDDRVMSVHVNATPEGGRVIVVNDVTEQRAFEEALVMAREDAESASQAKSAFLANISHELRTPLNAILGFSELIIHQSEAGGDLRPYVSYLQDIHDSGRHLLNIINDILDFSKIEAGKYALVEDEILVSDQVEFALRMLRSQATAKDLQLEARYEDDEMLIVADETAIRRVVLNLVSNAVKFTGAGGQVTVSCTRNAAGGLDLTVSDSGIGMREEDIQRAFEPFRQIRVHQKSATEGTGLGLAIVRALAELHQGGVAIDSAFGRGTTVTVSLPPERVRGGVVAEAGAPRTTGPALGALQGGH